MAFLHVHVACVAILTILLAGRGYSLEDWDWYTDCGGVIPISSLHLARLSYKHGQTYNPFEFCVWTLLPHDGITKVELAIYRKNASPTPTSDGLIAYTWNSTGLTSYKIPLPTDQSHVRLETPFDIAFLTFSSNCCEVSEGIAIGIHCSGSPGTTRGRAYHIENVAEGEFAYPEKGGLQGRYINGDRVSMVVMGHEENSFSSKPKEVKLDVDIEADLDSVAVYELGGYWQETHKLIANATGRNEAIFSTSAFHPMLLLFKSDQKVTGTGFAIQWKDFPAKIKL